MLQWALENLKWDELLGAFLGIVYLYFSVRQKVWLWPIGILSSSFYIFVFFRSQLYADMSLNVYYLVVSIYGWYHWLTRKDNSTHESIKITLLSLKAWGISLVLLVFFTVLLALALIYIPQKIGLTPSAVPWWDAFITSGSIIATWMLARKILEQWLWWIVIDAIAVGVFFYKELYFTVILFVVNTSIAVVGYINWRKDYYKQ